MAARGWVRPARPRRSAFGEALPWLMIGAGVALVFVDGPVPVGDLVGIPLAGAGVATLAIRSREE